MAFLAPLGAVFGGVATALSIGGFLGNAALTGLKIVGNVISKILYSALMIVLVPFQGIMGWIFYNTDQLLKDLKSEKFDGTRQMRTRSVSGVGIVAIVEMVIEELRGIILDMVTYLSPMFLALPWLIPVGIGILVILIIEWASTSFVFIVIEVVYAYFIYVLNLWAFYLNFVMAFCEAQYVPINAFGRFIADLARVMFGILCSGAPYIGDPQHDCPLLWQVYLLLASMWEYYMSLAILLWGLLVDAWNQMGSSICPGGTCDPTLCQKYLGVSSCSWGFQFAFSLIAGIFVDFITIFFFAFLILLVFFLDVIASTIANFAFMVSKFLPTGLSALLSSVAAVFGGGSTTLENLYVPYIFNDMKQVFLFAEVVVSVIEGVIVNTIVTISGLVDGFFCYVFRDPYNCIGQKVCYLIFYDFTLEYDLYIGKIKIPLYIPIQLRTAICVQLLKFDPYACPTTCDFCPIQPFGVPIVSAPFFTYANTYHMNDPNAPYGYIPCNLGTGCCNAAYTLMINYL